MLIHYNFYISIALFLYGQNVRRCLREGEAVPLWCLEAVLSCTVAHGNFRFNYTCPIDSVQLLISISFFLFSRPNPQELRHELKNHVGIRPVAPIELNFFRPGPAVVWSCALHFLLILAFKYTIGP